MPRIIWRYRRRVYSSCLPASISELPFPAPVRRHPFAAVKASILLRGPIPLVAPLLKVGLGALRQEHRPSRLEAGPRLFEGCGAAGLVPTRPSPTRIIVRDANALGDGADSDVTIEYLPAFLSRIAGQSAGELGIEHHRACRAVSEGARPCGGKRGVVQRRGPARPRWRLRHISERTEACVWRQRKSRRLETHPSSPNSDAFRNRSGPISPCSNSLTNMVAWCDRRVR